jgi:TRAP-type mannitol/chloroaromatic compound transport system permease small subunit
MSHILKAQRAMRETGLWVACAFLFIIMLLGSADAITSFVWNTPIPSMLELSETLLAAGVFMALASVGAQHVRVDILVERLSPSKQAFCTALALLVSFVVFAAMAWQFWGLAVHSINVREAAAALMPFPIWPAKVLAAIGTTLAATQALLDLTVLSLRETRLSGLL